ncbi:MAG: hypothetical protein JO307_30760 [Bryobacterales bacterium]|nr:hypothetical protein [Bryobacterales bacterium]MBV9398205.1 hypothetical protein [Bryobacterales bacterium]
MLRSVTIAARRQTADASKWGRLSVFVACVLFPLSAGGAIFPEQIGPFHRNSAKPVAAADAPLFQEYGFEEAEQASYAGGQGNFQAIAWRFKDSTGALAFLEFHKAEAPSAYLQGNYVLQLTGTRPVQQDLEAFYLDLPRYENSPLPVLKDDLPKNGLIPNSERYVVGPVSLERFQPAISPSVAAFHLGTEAQLGTYSTPKGPMVLAIYNYPTPAIAMERYNDFQKVPGAIAKRAGPLLAVIVQPPDADAAERLLAQVAYNINLMWNEQLGGPTVTDSAKMILTIMVLAGIVLGLCLVAGIAFGGFRVVLRKLGWKGPDSDMMITLRLEK